MSIVNDYLTKVWINENHSDRAEYLPEDFILKNPGVFTESIENIVSLNVFGQQMGLYPIVQIT